MSPLLSLFLKLDSWMVNLMIVVFKKWSTSGTKSWVNYFSGRFELSSGRFYLFIVEFLFI